MALCTVLDGLGVIGFAITVLSLVHVLPRLEFFLDRLLAAIRTRLRSLLAKAKHGTHLALFGATLWVVAGIALPLILVGITVVAAVHLNPVTLIHNPQYTLYAVIPISLVLLALASIRGIRRNTSIFYIENRLFVHNVIWYCVSVVAALSMPYLLFVAFDYLVRPEVILFLLIWPLPGLMMYAMMNAWLYIISSITGLFIAIVLLCYYFLSFLNRHPVGAISLLSGLISIVSFVVPRYLGACT